MARDGKSWLRRRLEDGIRSAFTKAYDTIKVDPRSTWNTCAWRITCRR